jgi:hypothetical protein
MRVEEIMFNNSASALVLVVLVCHGSTGWATPVPTATWICGPFSETNMPVDADTDLVYHRDTISLPDYAWV